MKGAELAGYNDYHKGVPKNRNPFQYSSNMFKQAQWLTGWQKAEKEEPTKKN